MGHTNLQVGASLRTDFGGDSTYALLFRHQWLALNRRGAEWVNTAQVGDRGLLFSEFHQPLGWGLRWYVRPKVRIGQESLDIWLDGERVAEYRIERSEAAVDFGRYFGKWGDLHGALFRGVWELDDRANARMTDREVFERGFPSDSGAATRDFGYAQDSTRWLGRTTARETGSY